MISVTGLTKLYGKLRAVDSLSFKVAPGEVLGFLGVNGAGKTTTLRMICGILHPTEGSITVDDLNLAISPQETKKLLGYIPDRPYLYGKLTTREFLNFIADLYGVHATQRSHQIDQLLSEYGLQDVEHSLIEGLSHGMKQRVTTCAALVHQPRYLIIDEPMVGLDPHGATLFKKKIREYAKKGMGVILSTHSLGVAQQIADRFLILEHGRIVASGDLDQLRQLVSQGDSHDLEQLFLALTSSPLIQGDHPISVISSPTSSSNER
jgi:ABC-2 type transport system ATP-binding protein